MNVYKLSLYKYDSKIKKAVWNEDVTLQTENTIEKMMRDLQVEELGFKNIIAHYFGLEYDPVGGDILNIGKVEVPFHKVTQTDLSKAQLQLRQEITETWA